MEYLIMTQIVRVEEDGVEFFTVGATVDTPRAEAAGILKTIISVLKALTKCLY